MGESGSSAAAQGQSAQAYQAYLGSTKPSHWGDLTQLPKRIEALAALARELKAHKKANGQVQLPSGSDKLVSGFSPENCEKICATLSKYLEAVNKVQTGLQRDLVHLDIVEKHGK